MVKIAMIGAGSVGFSRSLTSDILSYPEFKDATFTYMDIAPERLEVGGILCHKVAASLGATPRIEMTLDRREALKGADFVINMIQIGGFDATLLDFEIPRRYGLHFTIADTTGPGGLFRALRTYTPLREMCEEMTQLCPHAWLLNYTNPMSMNMQTITRTSDVSAVGLCHSVQSTQSLIARYLGENPADVNYLCAGINHMAFFLKLEKAGHDLYPQLFEAMHDPAKFATNKVRFELMKRLGYFVTESSEHNAEYSSFFIPHGEQVIQEFGVSIDEYLRRSDSIVDEFARLKAIAHSDEPMRVQKSNEYGPVIMHSIVTGTPAVVYGNMPNRGAIANLPATAIVEVPTLCDGNGLQFTRIGEIPPQLVGYMQPHITQHELFIRAAMEGRRDHLYQACMFDPLTAAVLSPDKIVEMCDEMIQAYGDLLPPLDTKKSLVATSGKTFSPPTPQQLRESWDAAQKLATADLLLDWKVIGPFTATENAALDSPTPVEETYLSEGSINFSQTYPDKEGDHPLLWQHLPRAVVRIAKQQAGYINLTPILGTHQESAAYGLTSVDEMHPREAVLRVGSTGPTKLWLNGELVFHREKCHSSTLEAREIVIQLREGANHFLLKTQGQKDGWGYSLALPPANY